jgi:hypothetical protein
MLDLDQFCCVEDDQRFAALGQPWSAGEYTYATNGHILVRVPRRPDAPENDLAPSDKAEAVIGKGYGGEFFPVPPVQLPPATEEKCPECGGRGTEHDCPDCECDCKGCDGAGAVQDRSWVEVGEAFFATGYVRRILGLPGLEISLSPTAKDPLSFKFDGGIGLLMPVESGGRMQPGGPWPVIATISAA